MDRYVILALISTLLFGTCTVIQKRAPGIDAVTFALIQVGTAFVLILLYWLCFRRGAPPSAAGALHAVTVGVFFTAAMLLFLTALQLGQASTVAMLNSLSALVAVVLAVIFLSERLTLQHTVGIVLGIAAVILLGKR